MATPTPTVPAAVGQVWKDMDPREQDPPRYFVIESIDDTHAHGRDSHRNGEVLRNARKVRIRLDRLRGSARSGWTLVKDAS